MKASVATLSQCIASTLMHVEHQRIGRRVMGHPRNKQTRGPLTRDSINTAKGADQWTRAVITVEARL
jgi:hypothetical protein